MTAGEIVCHPFHPFAASRCPISPPKRVVHRAAEAISNRCCPTPSAGLNTCVEMRNKTVERFLAGDGEEVHTVALATQRAELAFETFLQVRNKVVSAYQAVMQMQV